MCSLHLLPIFLFLLLPLQTVSQLFPVQQLHQLELRITPTPFVTASPLTSPQILLPSLDGGDNNNNNNNVSNAQPPQPASSITPTSTPTPSSQPEPMLSDADPNTSPNEDEPDESPESTTDEPIGVGAVSNTGSRVGGLVAASITLALVVLISTATAFFIIPRTASVDHDAPIQASTGGATEATGIASHGQPV